jgi:hypothetical protein
MDIAQIESQALKLSESDRAVLVDHLQASLSSKKISYLEEHVSEAKDRLSAYRTGKVRSFDGASFVASLRNSLS